MHDPYSNPRPCSSSSTACCKGGLHGYRSAMTSTIRWKFLNHWNGLLFAGVEYAFKRKGVDFCIHNFGRWIFTFGSMFFDQTKGGLPVRSKSLRRILQDFFPKNKMPWFCRGLVLPLFCEGFFRIFSEAGIPEFFSFHWRLSRTFNGCQDAQDDDCLLGLGGLGARPSQLSRWFYSRPFDPPRSSWRSPTTFENHPKNGHKEL